MSRPSSLNATRRAVERKVALGLFHLPKPLVNAIGMRRRKTIEGRTLDAQCAALIELDSLRGEVDVSQLTPSQARRRLAAGVAILDLKRPPDVDVREVSVQGAAGPLRARFYSPAGLPTVAPLIVYFHGGGWVTCDLDTHEAFCTHLAKRAGVRVISVDYRLAPEHPFPAPIDDATAAFLDVASRASEFGGDLARVAVMGDSAGGNLSAVIAHRTARSAVRPALQILLYPAVDATFSFASHQTFADGYILTERSIRWYLDHYARPDVDRRHPDLSPLFSEDFKGLPRALVYTAGFDPLRDEGAAYVQKLSAAGVQVLYRELPTLVHGFSLMGAAIDAARDAIASIADDVAQAFRS